MSSAMKAAILSPQSHFTHIRTALFHSTPVLERKRRTFWESRSNGYNKRYRRMGRKQEVLRNVNAFADHLFQSWHDEFCGDDPCSSRRSSWFKKQYCKGSKTGQSSHQGRRNWGRSRFEFCQDDDELEIDYIFRSAFGGNRSFCWSFIREEEPQWRWRSSSYSNNSQRSRNSGYRFEEEEEEDDEDGYSSMDSEDSDSNLAFHRLALGLSPSGPLNLEQVKIAYRACALKWHPDRHQGSSKTVAEEKFKLCSAAYQSLCDKLALN